VNLELTVPGLPPQQFENVADAAACAGSVNSWHYDDQIAPKQVALCPDTCAAVKAAIGATVNVVFGCETRRVQ
jgi:hypothetical protein